MTEQWRSVPGYVGLYRVSDYGRVFAEPRDVYCGHPGAAPQSKPGALLQGNPVGTPRTHLAVGLTRDGQRRQFKIHQLVMLAFVGPCPDGLEVLHWDDDPTNNHLHNLRYGTRSENQRDRVRNGRHHLASRTECIHGHAFTPDNTYRPPGTNRRMCRACLRTRKKERRAQLTTTSKGI